MGSATIHNAKSQRLINGHWKLEKEFGHNKPGRLSRAVDIAVNSDNNIAVVDQEAGNVKVYSQKGKYKFKMDTTKGLKRGRTSCPSQIAVTSQGRYFVTDSVNKQVKMFDVKGKFKGQLPSLPSFPSMAFAQLNKDSPCRDSSGMCGMAIDRKGNLLVGDGKRKRINKQGQDGSFLATIEVAIKPMNIGGTSQETIVVADRHEPPLLINDIGQVLCTLNHPVCESHWDPTGLCCFEDLVIVANNDDNSNNILCYSDYGQYIGHIPVDISSPSGVSLTDNGKRLIVCNEAMVKVFAC